MKILIRLADGTLAVVTPIAAREDGQSEAEYLAKRAAVAIAKAGLAGATVLAYVPDAVVESADRYFRKAWDWAASLEIDMPKARTIVREDLRDERAKRFAALDGAWMRATARGDQQAAAVIEAKREALRNWPSDPRIDASPDAVALRTLIQDMKKEQ